MKKNITTSKQLFQNFDSSFTELFSLLKRYDHSSSDTPTLAYHSDELQIVYQHTDNAIDVLLQGMQSVGQLIGRASLNTKTMEDLNNIGFFISTISNLTEALNALRADTDHTLKQRGIVNY